VAVSECDEVTCRDATTLDVVGHHAGQPVGADVDEDDGDAGTAQALEMFRRGGQGHDEEPVGAFASQRRQVLVTVQGRLDVEQHQVVTAAGQGGHHPPKALDRRRLREEGDDHAERLAAAP
jgi:hypothetical protein